MIWFLRWAVLLLLGLALWDPKMPWQKHEVDVFVLPDDSLSMQTSGHSILQLNASEARSDHDAWIKDLHVPLYGNANQQIPVSVTLASNYPTEAKLTLSINQKARQTQTIRLSPNQITGYRFLADACAEKDCIVTVDLQAGQDSIPQNNTRHAGILIDKRKSALYIHDSSQKPALLAYLETSTYQVKATRPQFCMPSETALQAFDVIILDDVAIPRMPADCWSTLAKAVRNAGVGLIVLGGPNSFSAGAYRRSLLEELLPVTAEAAQPQASAALLFVVDKSGSMDADGSSASRLTLAREAILQTLRAQSSNDSVGLISFDVSPRLLVPLQRHADPVDAILRHFDLRAAGGTRLKPALDLALAEFGKTQADNKILLLVTDGFLDERETSAIAQQISAQKIDVIALAIGRDADTKGLQHLTASGRGKLLIVDDVVELPVLMRKEIEQKRTPLETGKITVKQMHPPPITRQDGRWPDVTAYRVTKAKQQSRVYLSAPNGDPLLAAHYAGTGNVIALPAGLGAWAESWLAGDDAERFIQRLLDWAAGNNPNDSFDIRVGGTGDDYFQIDAVTTDLEWKKTPSGKIFLSGRQGEFYQLDLKASAPGRYVGKIGELKNGFYKAALEIGETRSTVNFYHENLNEFIPTSVPDQDVTHLTTGDFDQTWDESARLQNACYRKPLLISALLLFLTRMFIANKPMLRIVFRNRLTTKWSLKNQ